MILQSTPSLLVKEISDSFTRKNFQNLYDYFQSDNQLLNFKFFEVVFDNAQTNKKVAHGLTFTPQDIIVTKLVGAGAVTFNHGLFDNTNLDLTSTGACRVRFFVGLYWNFQSTVNAKSDDKTTYSETFTQGTTVTQVQIPLTPTQISSGSFPGSNASSYQVRALTDSYIFANPQASGLTVFLPSASECTDQFIYVQNVNSSGNDMSIKVNAKTPTDYINASGTLSYALNSYQSKVALISNGTYFRTVYT